MTISGTHGRASRVAATIAPKDRAFADAVARGQNFAGAVTRTRTSYNRNLFNHSRLPASPRPAEMAALCRLSCRSLGGADGLIGGIPLPSPLRRAAPAPRP